VDISATITVLLLYILPLYDLTLSTKCPAAGSDLSLFVEFNLSTSLFSYFQIFCNMSAVTFFLQDILVHQSGTLP
jgi:hypothetical protein